MDTTGEDPRALPGETSTINRAPIVAVLIVGAFVAVLNETLLHIAFPDVMREYSIPITVVQWLASVYMLVVGTLVPVTALLQQWFTTRQLFMSATTLFFVGSVICGFSPSFAVLLTGRAVQALGTGLLLPVLMNTMLLIYPPERRGGAMGMFGLVVMCAPAIGPTLSGLIIDALSWRWLFHLIAVPALCTVGLAACLLKNVSDITKPKVDVVSIVLSFLGFGGVVYGLSQAARGVPSESIVVWPLAVGGVALGLFIWRQLAGPAPILELRAFRYPVFRVVMAMLFLLMMVMFAVGVLLSQFLLNVLAMSATTVGLSGLLPGIAYAVMSLVSGKLFDRFGARFLVAPGIVLALLSLWAFTRLNTHTTVAYVIAVNTLLFISIPLAVTPAQTTGLNALPRHLYPHGAAITNTLMQIAGAVGIPIFVGIVARANQAFLHSMPAAPPLTEQLSGFAYGIRSAFRFSIVIGLAALVLSLFLLRTRPGEQSHS